MTLDQIHAIRNAKIKLARIDFWEFCVLEDPGFFHKRHGYLRDLAKLLQDFHERKLGAEGRVYERMIINMPPRHGKTRIVSLFEAWLLGIDPRTKIITGSYNDAAASDISRNVRNKIAEDSTEKWKVIYREIFPESAIKIGDSSVMRWALEGQFFNYLASGVGGSATGKGCSVLVVDDPVKNAEQANNKLAMDTVTTWMNDTMLSRMEGNALFLIVMTRWPGGDPCEDALTGQNAGLYYHYTLPAHLGSGKMLNEDVLSYETYMARKKDTSPEVFAANYDQQIIVPRNALYRELKTYERLPRDDEGKERADRKIAYTDTAEGGGDYVCSIAGVEADGNVYVTGVVYTAEAHEEAEPEVAEMLVRTGTKEAMFESNTGGKRFAESVDRIIRATHNVFSVSIDWEHQSANKETRILTNASNIQRRVYFPVDWETKWPEFCVALRSYVRVGRNKHDDAPDALTGLLEFCDNGGVILL